MKVLKGIFMVAALVILGVSAANNVRAVETLTLVDTISTPNNNDNSLAIKGNYLYLGAHQPDFNINVYNITDPYNIAHVGSTSSLGWQELWDLDICGDYLYVAHDAIGLVIYDITDPINPVLRDSRSDGTYTHHVYIDENTYPYAYVTYSYTDGGEMAIYNVANPDSIVLVAQYDATTTMHGVDVWVQDDIAYLLNSDKSSEYYLDIVDVSTPSSPTKLGIWEFSTLPWGEIVVRDDYAYIAFGDRYETIGGLRVVNVADPDSAFLVGSYLIPGYLDWRGKSLTLDGNYAYVGTGFSANMAPPPGTIIGLWKLDISDPENPTLIDSIDLGPTAGTDGGPYKIGLKDDFAFLAIGGSGVPYGLQIVSTVEIEIPELVLSDSVHDFGDVDVGDYYDWAFQIINVGENTACVDSVKNSLAVYQAVSPAFPQDMAPDETLDVTVRFSPTYVASYDDILYIYSSVTSKGHLKVILHGNGMDTTTICTLSVADASGTPSESGIPVEICLNNQMGVGGVQFILKFDGSLVAADSVIATARTSLMDFGSSIWPDSVKVLLYSASGDSILPGEGSIADVFFSVDFSSPPEDSMLLEIRNPVLSDPDANPLSFTVINGWFWFEGVEKGDVNGDGEIDILDLVRLVNIILGNPPPPVPYELWAADLNDDDNVNVLDVVALINLILGKKIDAVPEGRSNPVSVSLMSCPDAEADRINVAIDVTNAIPIVGIQLNLEYDPTVFTPTVPQTTERSTGFEIASHADAGEITVVLYDLSGVTIKPGVGAVITIPGDIISAIPENTKLAIKEIILAGEDGSRLQAEVKNSFHAPNPVPGIYSLRQNSPNPVYDKTEIEYLLPRKGRVSLRIYNTAGQLIRTLVDKELQPGYHRVWWDLKDEQGRVLSPGIYFYRLDVTGNSERFTAAKKLILIH